jgi:glutaconyl-CoA/methylmalonyl-CoA decarboxylase subunit gamma
MKRLRITLEGKAYEVGVEVLTESAPAYSASPVTPFAVQPQAVASVPAVAAQPVAVASAPAVGAQPVVDGYTTTVFCPMSAVVLKCPVKPGDFVAIDQAVMVLEAMKMENSVYAPVAGTVRSVLVKEGDAVDEEQALLQIDGGAQ